MSRLSLLCLLTLLAACGQKGPLVPPPKAAPATIPPAASAAPAPATPAVAPTPAPAPSSDESGASAAQP